MYSVHYDLSIVVYNCILIEKNNYFEHNSFLFLLWSIRLQVPSISMLYLRRGPMLQISKNFIIY